MVANIGAGVRDIRKSKKLTMKQLAEKVGVSLLTIQRIETNKSSPSVALLSEIAHQLESPISKFMPEEFGNFTLVKAKAIPVVKSLKTNLSLLVPKGLIDDHISISLAKVKPGKSIQEHYNEGFEITYILKGKCTFKHGSHSYDLNEGDLIYFDGKIVHSVIVSEYLEFISVYLRDKKGPEPKNEET
jgi:transcriptional regulator with XRE-family HTH domain